MAHVGNKGWFILNADAAPTFDPTGSYVGGIASVAGTAIVYFHTTGTTWNRIDIGALSAADGNDTPVARGNATAGVAPTVGEVASPVAGDTASIYLTDGKLEKWVYTTSWALAYTLQGDLASNLSNGTVTATTYPINNSNGTGVVLAAATSTLAGVLSAADKVKIDFISITQAVDLDELEAESANLVTLSGVASDSVNLGAFTGTTIADNVTIKAALQALETALETYTIKTEADTNSVNLTVTAGVLTADVKRSATQDNEFSITESADGLRVTKQTLTAYASHALADASVAVGAAYILTVTNLEGIPSDGNSGPVFRRV